MPMPSAVFALRAPQHCPCLFVSRSVSFGRCWERHVYSGVGRLTALVIDRVRCSLFRIARALHRPRSRPRRFLVAPHRRRSIPVAAGENSRCDWCGWHRQGIAGPRHTPAVRCAANAPPMPPQSPSASSDCHIPAAIWCVSMHWPGKIPEWLRSSFPRGSPRPCGELETRPWPRTSRCEAVCFCCMCD
jgi:hypothetical protein